MAEPHRIQLKRSKGYKKPDGAVVVARPTKWGNPFTIPMAIEVGFASDEETARKVCVEAFREWLTLRFQNWWIGPESERRLNEMVSSMGELSRKDLACWCPLDKPCHADVLLEIANA